MKLIYLKLRLPDVNGEEPIEQSLQRQFMKDLSFAEIPGTVLFYWHYLSSAFKTSPA